ncbi:MAG TPA: Mur ligase family protein [Gemmatimonadales bacterium]|nr:Mur ligase family protein [Gemmatimonadales bacterium]
MRLLDSRRLTGPGLVLDRPGVVLDLEVDAAHREAAADAWREAVHRLLLAVGWRDARIRTREFGTGLSLAFTAPPDVLYAAAELNECAWAAAQAAIAGTPAPPAETAAERLRQLIVAEQNPGLLAMRAAAEAHGVTFLHGEELVSVGSGRGVRIWPEREVPPPAAVPWAEVHDIPTALVTGSNGKTTVVRLLAAMAAATGRVSGLTSTDAVRVAGRTVDEGDFSGPNGARLLLRQPELEVAILETARGGLLRRGLAVTRADAAVVTNVADDHLGEFGVETLEALAETKLLVARAVGPHGRLALNADDPVLTAGAAGVTAPIAWFALDPDRPQLGTGPAAATVQGDAVMLRDGGTVEPVARVDEIPLAMGGAARHNLANVLAALAAAGPLGIPLPAARDTLRRFGRDLADNPGRANLLEVGGVQIVIDYAHNPHGMQALAGIAAAIPCRRRLVLLGQAGDRSDSAIRDLARAAMALGPDQVVVKEMDRYLRGRVPGEVPAILADEFRRMGLGAAQVLPGGPELEAARVALAWARPGDLLVLALHQDRDEVMALIERLRSAGWTAGEPVEGAVPQGR